MKKIVIGILSLSFLGITLLVLTNQIEYFDDIIYQHIISFGSENMDILFKGITSLANTISIMIITFLLLLFLKRKDQITLLITILFTVSVNQILKHIIGRSRPAHIRLVEESGYSYPSGHAMISIALYGFLIYYVYQKVKNKYLKAILISLLILLIMGIGCSRIYVGVHYPSDVLGGYSLALIILLMIIEYFNRGNSNDKNDCE